MHRSLSRRRSCPFTAASNCACFELASFIIAVYSLMMRLLHASRCPCSLSQSSWNGALSCSHHRNSASVSSWNCS